ncbi:MAG: CDP-alcohol phosphatidyltransferase family protein [Chitinophagaceae bacterium]
MAKLPVILIYTRLALGFFLICLSISRIPDYAYIAVALTIFGLLTDIFDGIIARKLGVSTQRLRRLDSSVDQVFFISVAIATYIQCPEFFKTNMMKLIILFSTEGLAYLICYLKFKKEIATHTIGAKIWTLLMVATLLQIMLQCESGILFQLFFWVGMVTRIEIIAILFILKQWAHDIPSVYQAIQIRRGINIKRHKWLNG